MLTYLTGSDVRIRLLELLWIKEDVGNVSELAALAGTSFSAAYQELHAMRDAGLAVCSRRGNAKMFRARRDHPDAEILIALLRTERRASNAIGLDDGVHRRVRRAQSLLKTLGAPLPAKPIPKGSMVSLEEALAEGAWASRHDTAVARVMPVCLWSQRHRIDPKRLLVHARRVDAKRATGMLLELTAVLSRDRSFRKWADAFQDKRVRRQEDFFLRPHSKYEKRLADKNTPAAARRWHFRMNMGLDSFESTFAKFAKDDGTVSV